MIREAKTENGWVRGIEAADPRITVWVSVCEIYGSDKVVAEEK